MATTADFRNGLCIVFKDDLYTIVQFQHVKPGKGPAFVRTKLRNVKTAVSWKIRSPQVSKSIQPVLKDVPINSFTRKEKIS